MNAVGSALYGTLTGGTALTAQLAGTGAVYNQQAPEGAALPYMVFSKAGGGPENIDPHDRRDLTYWIRAYADSAKTAGAIDGAASTILHRATLTVTGYRTIWCVRETEFEMVENPPDGVPVYMAGAYYRIRIT